MKNWLTYSMPSMPNDSFAIFAKSRLSIFFCCRALCSDHWASEIRNSGPELGAANRRGVAAVATAAAATERNDRRDRFMGKRSMQVGEVQRSTNGERPGISLPGR